MSSCLVPAGRLKGARVQAALATPDARKEVRAGGGGEGRGRGVGGEMGGEERGGEEGGGRVEEIG